MADAYIKEVVDADRNRQQKRLEDLERLYAEKEMEMRSRRTALKQLVEQLGGAGESGAISIRQTIAMQAYGDARNQLYKLRAELQQARDDLQIKQAWLKALRDSPGIVRPGAVHRRRSDHDPSRRPDYGVHARIANLHESTKEPLLSALVQEFTQMKKALEAKRDARRKESCSAPGASRRISAPNSWSSRPASKSSRPRKRPPAKTPRRKAEGRAIRQPVDRRANDAKRTPVPRKGAGSHRRRAGETQGRTSRPPRISIFQRPDVPKVPDSRARLSSTAMAGGGGFFGVILLVLWWDVGRRRINSLADLSRGLGLTVVGAVPLLPGRVIEMGSAGTENDAAGASKAT